MDLTAFRRDLHANPEVGFDLPRTAARVADVLEAAGLDVTRGVGRSGVVATLRRGGNPIGLRADMDALPIDEAGTPPYRSTHPGRFHGCGHDGHTAMLVGAALRLARDADLTRDVHFIFQPDEETGHGAQAMINDGLFDRFPMAAIYGLHNLPGLPVGHFATAPGAFCAFEDLFEIRVTGKGGHASMPETGVDPIVVASAIVMQLQTIPSRNVSARDHCVVSVTDFQTDGARNILASEVRLTGDCRGFDASVSDTIRARMTDIAQGVAAAHGATVDVRYETAFVPLINDPTATDRMVAAAHAVGTVDHSYGRVGFSEDFAAFLTHCPGGLILMGNGTAGAHGLPLHNPGYDFNDAALDTGIAYWCALARDAGN